MAAHSRISRSKDQAALAGLVEGRRTAARPDAAHDTEGGQGMAPLLFKLLQEFCLFRFSHPLALDQQIRLQRLLLQDLLDLAHILIGRKKHHIISRPALGDDPDIVRHLPEPEGQCP